MLPPFAYKLLISSDDTLEGITGTSWGHNAGVMAGRTLRSSRRSASRSDHAYFASMHVARELVTERGPSHIGNHLQVGLSENLSEG